MNCLQTTPCWEEFTKAFCREFGPFEFEDNAEALFKLRQSGTLKDYILEFRRLANHTKEVGPSPLKSCFSGDLKCELKYDVKLFRPANVHEAIAIFVQLDEKLAELKTTTYVASQSAKPPPLALPHAVYPKNRQVALPFMKLTPTEV